MSHQVPQVHHQMLLVHHQVLDLNHWCTSQRLVSQCVIVNRCTWCTFFCFSFSFHSFFRNFAAVTANLLGLGRKNKRVCFVLLSTFRNFVTSWRTYLALGRKNKRVCFVLLSFFRNFVRILSFSLYKGSLGDWGKTGLRIGNRTQFHILLWIASKNTRRWATSRTMAHHRVQR